MIGAELLNLLFGNPLNQLAGAMNPTPQPAPNPNPGASPPGAPPPGAPVQHTGYMQPVPSGPPPGGPRPMMPPGALGMPAGGPQGAPPPNAPPGPPPGQQGLPPSAATQSPPDLAQLYLQLEQRNRSANEIEHGLDLMAASMSTPSMANAIMGSQRQGADPGAQLGNLIQLQNMQRLQAARPAMVAALSGGQGGMDPNVLNALPTDQLAGLMNDRAKAQIGIGTDLAKQKQTDLLEAQQKSPQMNTQLLQMDTAANQIRSATEADGTTPVMQGILSSPLKKAAAQKLMEADPKEAPGALMSQLVAAGLTPEEQGALMQMKTLNAQVYGEAFQSTGSRRTGTEVANLRAGMTPLTNFTQPYDKYMGQFDTFQNQLHKSIANNLGAAQELDAIPEQYRFGPDGKPNVDQSYLPGGTLYEGRGGQWVNNPPPKQGGGPVAISGPADIAKLPRGTPFVIPSGPNQGKIGYAQ
jgi:hypothetical protein